MPERNLLDRAIETVAPQWALRRAQARARLFSAYQGASRTRDALRGWTTSKGDADTDILPELDVLRTNSRDLTRNNPIASGAKNTEINHVIGTGLRLHSTVDRSFLDLSADAADEWEKRAEREFRMWAGDKRSDARGVCRFPAQQSLAFGSVFDNGDHFVQITHRDRPGWPFRLCLQHIEADRVCNPKYAMDTDALAGGIERDSFGEPTIYHVAAHHPGSRLRNRTLDRWIPVAATTPDGRPNILHLHHVTRSMQSRGVPKLAPVIEPLKQMGRYTDLEIDAALKEAVFALVLKTSSENGLADLNYGNWKETRNEFYSGTATNLKEGSANLIELFPDDDITGFAPSRPSSAFDPFMQSFFQILGMGLNIPKEVLTKHFQSSYSAARAALLEATLSFMVERTWFSPEMCQEVYKAFCFERVATGAWTAPGFLMDPFIRSAYCGAQWIGDAPGHIDESKAVDAAERRVNLGVSTKTRETEMLTGQNWEKVVEQRQREARIEPEPEGKDDPQTD